MEYRRHTLFGIAFIIGTCVPAVASAETQVGIGTNFDLRGLGGRTELHVPIQHQNLRLVPSLNAWQGGSDQDNSWGVGGGLGAYIQRRSDNLAIYAGPRFGVTYGVHDFEEADEVQSLHYSAGLRLGMDFFLAREFSIGAEGGADYDWSYTEDDVESSSYGTKLALTARWYFL